MATRKTGAKRKVTTKKKTTKKKVGTKKKTLGAIKKRKSSTALVDKLRAKARSKSLTKPEKLTIRKAATILSSCKMKK